MRPSGLSFLARSAFRCVLVPLGDFICLGHRSPPQLLDLSFFLLLLLLPSLIGQPLRLALPRFQALLPGLPLVRSCVRMHLQRKRYNRDDPLLARCERLRLRCVHSAVVRDREKTLRFQSLLELVQPFGGCWGWASVLGFTTPFCPCGKAKRKLEGWLLRLPGL